MHRHDYRVDHTDAAELIPANLRWVALVLGNDISFHQVQMLSPDTVQLITSADRHDYRVDHTDAAELIPANLRWVALVLGNDISFHQVGGANG